MLRLAPIVDLSPHMDDGQIVAFNVGPDGKPYVVVAMRPLDYRIKHPSGATFAKSVPSTPQRYRILSLCDDEVALDVVIEQANFNVHDIQPLDQDLLLVGARSYYRGPDDFDLNGHVFDRLGRPLRSILLGDGIEAVQVTNGGVIWTGFFDEGVFGNYGWTEPVGASGLVAQDGAGKRLFGYEPPAGQDMILDCYALNVESESVVWCYYYTEFPLVRVRDFRVDASWRVPVRGSHAFAVGDGHALFRGGYDERDRYFLLSIAEQQEPTLLRQFALSTVEGVDLVADRAVGRGSAIWLLYGFQIYRLGLEQVLAD